jgi:hypothetical protein
MKVPCRGIMDLSFRNVIRSGPVNELDRLKFVWSLVAWLSVKELYTSVREKLEASHQISNRALERVPVLVLFL